MTRGWIAAVVFWIGFQAAAQPPGLNPDTFKLKQPARLDQASEVLEEILQYTNSHAQDFAPFHELERWGSSPVLVLKTREIRSHLSSKDPAPYSFPAHIDFDRDGALTLQDLYDFELFNSRWVVDQQLGVSISPATQHLKAEPYQDAIEAAVQRYRDLSTPQAKLTPQEQRELAQLQNFLVQAWTNLHLAQAGVSTRTFIEASHSLSELLEKDPQWRHRPSLVPHLVPASFVRDALKAELQRVIPQYPSAEQLLVRYPTVRVTSRWIENYTTTIAKLRSLLEQFNRENTLTFDAFLDAPSKHLKGQFSYSLKSPRAFQAYFKTWCAQVSRRGEPISTLLRLGMYGAPHFSTGTAQPQAIQNWVDFFEQIEATPISSNWQSRSSILAYSQLRKQFGVAVQWTAQPKDPMPDFSKVQESVGWEVLRGPKASSWVAEYYTQFLNDRLATIREVARRENVDLTQIEANLAALQKKKTQLQAKLKEAYLSEEAEAAAESELDRVIEQIDALQAPKDRIEQSPEVLAYDLKYVEQYKKRMGWATEYDVSKIAQIEERLGFSAGAREFFLFLQTVNHTQIFAEFDLNQDGVIDSKDVEVAKHLF